MLPTHYGKTVKNSANKELRKLGVSLIKAEHFEDGKIK